MPFISLLFKKKIISNWRVLVHSDVILSLRLLAAKQIRSRLILGICIACSAESTPISQMCMHTRWRHL